GVRGAHLTVCQPWRFAETAAREALCAHFGVLQLAGFGLAERELAVGAAGAILSYVEEHNRRLLPNLASLRTYSTTAGMPLDAHTRRNLELLRNGRSGRVEGSLLGVLDRTRTPMGGRLLRRWLSQPLLDRQRLERRLDAVEAAVRADRLRSQARALLESVGDLERQVGRVAQGVATPRELRALADSLGALARLCDLLERGAPPALLGALVDTDAPASAAAPLDPCTDVAGLIARAVARPGSGRLVQPGYSEELDRLIAEVEQARHWIARLEQAERQRTGIRSLKVGFNQVFGYYLEVTKPNLALVPADYQRKQTLVSAERFITPELKDRESQILHLEERIEALEREEFDRLLSQVASQGDRLRRLARAVAQLDVFTALAEVARERGYCRPLLDDSQELEIVDGRHPVVEVSLDPGSFIPNDTRLDGADCQVMVVTGPNMAGKSTYLRQVALIVLLAQIGSFVPARSARIGLVDRIFTRVGAEDDIASGKSTFMVEMEETATILHHATRHSLIILDEIGRGTSTYDGLAIARAVVEYLHTTVGARTLFATHYHELAEMAAELPHLRVYTMAITDEGADKIVFLHRVVPGSLGRSYGVHVARLAGMPAPIVSRAGEILTRLEAEREQVQRLLHSQPGNGHVPRGTGRSFNGHIGEGRYAWQSAEGQSIGQNLAGADLATLLDEVDVYAITPLDALNLLFAIQKKQRETVRASTDGANGNA